MDIELVNEENKDEWNAFVEFNNGTVFHLFEWPAVLNATYGYKPIYLCARGGEKIEGIMPAVITRKPFGRRLLSLPFADYAGPLAKNDASTKLLDFALKFCQYQKLTLEVYSVNPYPNLKSFHFFDTFILDTTRPFETIWMENFSKKVRNSVRKANKMGVVVKKETTQECLREYYRIYLATMRRTRSMPHYYDLFKNMWKFLGEKFEIFSARYEEELIAGLLVLVFNKRIHIWGNASKEKFLHLAPNNALYCEAIKWAGEKGITVVDFGSTPLDTTHYRFKEAWGGTPTPIYALADRELKAPGKISRLIRFLPNRMLGFASRFAFKYLF